MVSKDDLELEVFMILNLKMLRRFGFVNGSIP